jgi:hypothetical protein
MAGEQLSFDPPAEDWWECGNDASTIFVRAGDAAEARAKAEAHLRDLGVLPGGPPGLHESYRRMCAFATKGRRHSRGRATKAERKR